jgi:CheY-like chemotaxis protein
MPIARIALIEDNPTNLELMQYLLHHFGYQTLVATDGEQGLALVRQEHPDLILCDLQLPLIDGYALAGQIKADPTLRDIPLLAVTAFSMTGDEEKTLAAGFLAYFAKPIDPESFVAQMEQFLPPPLRSAGGASAPVPPG